MKELIDLKKLWDSFLDLCKTNIGLVICLVISFLIGMAIQEKMIVDDCKYMNNFRDGAQSYKCTLNRIS